MVKVREGENKVFRWNYNVRQKIKLEEVEDGRIELQLSKVSLEEKRFEIRIMTNRKVKRQIMLSGETSIDNKFFANKMPEKTWRKETQKITKFPAEKEVLNSKENREVIPTWNMLYEFIE